jgi:type IV fimbrial biogenesis protein FimT
MVIPMVSASRQSGISLIEVMITIAIVAVLAAVAMPGMTSLVAAQRLKAASSDLYTSLLLARSEAIKRNTEIQITPSANGWAGGWTVERADGDGDPMEVHGAFPAITISGPDSLSYTGNGRLDGAASPEFDLSGEGTENVRCVKVDLSGRPSTKQSAC